MKIRHTVLCVDDEVDNLDLLYRALHKKYDVLTADTPEKALDLLKQQNISLIIADERMPAMSGIDLLSLAIEHSPTSVRMILTGYKDEVDLIKAVNSARLFRVMIKPWELEELRRVVSKAIEYYQDSQHFDRSMARLNQENEQLKHQLQEIRQTAIRSGLDSTFMEEFKQAIEGFEGDFQQAQPRDWLLKTIVPIIERAREGDIPLSILKLQSNERSAKELLTPIREVLRNHDIVLSHGKSLFVLLWNWPLHGNATMDIITARLRRKGLPADDIKATLILPEEILKTD